MFLLASTQQEPPLASVKDYKDSIKEIAPEDSSLAPEISEAINQYSKTLFDIGRSPLINSLVIQVFHFLSEKKINDLTLHILGNKFAFRYAEGFNSSMYSVEKFQIVRSFVLLSLVSDWYKRILMYIEQFENMKATSSSSKITGKDSINVISFQETILSLLKETIANCIKCLEEYFKNETTRVEFQQNSLPALNNLFSSISNFSSLEIKDNKIDVSFVSISSSSSNKVFELFSQKAMSLIQQNLHIILNESQRKESKTNLLSLTAWISHCLQGKDFEDCICTADLINSLILGTIKKDNIENKQNNKIILGFLQNYNELKDIKTEFSSEVARILIPALDFNFLPVDTSLRVPNNEWIKAKEEYTYNIENKGKEVAKEALENQLNTKNNMKYASLLLLGAPVAAYVAYGKTIDDEDNKSVVDSSLDMEDNAESINYVVPKPVLDNTDNMIYSNKTTWQ